MSTSDYFCIIIDRLTAIITNVLQENAELKRELKERERTIATMAVARRSEMNESQQ